MLFNTVITLSALTALATATAIPRTDGGLGDSGIVCCEQVLPASTVLAGPWGPILDLLGIVGPPDGLYGLNCSPITVIGNGNGFCPSGTTEVICDDNSHGSLIHTGCVPVNI